MNCLEKTGRQYRLRGEKGYKTSPLYFCDMREIKAIIFDFDGTLTPLTLDFGHLRDEVVAIAERYVPGDVISDLAGHYIIEMIYEIGDMLDGRGKGFTEEAFERLRILEVEMAHGKNLFPYARDVLEDLKSKNMKVAIITRNCMDALKTVFPDMDEYMDAVVTRDHIRLVKPDPIHVKEALRLLSVNASESIVVGDHPTDVMAGRAAGTITAAVLTGRTGHAALKAVGPTHIIDDIRGMSCLIRGFNGASEP